MIGAYGQTVDCYPNCRITRENVLNERVPLFTSVAATSNHCDADIIIALKKQFTAEDDAQMTLLRNQYCSAISGWEQVGDCIHGGPPPCCTYTGPNPPWINIGPEQATDKLMKEWHALRDNRHAQIQNALNQCLASLTNDRTNTFNLVYQQALECLSGLKASTAYMEKNSETYNNFVYRLNPLHDQAQTWINDNDPDNLQNVINTLIPLKNEICNVKIPDEPLTQSKVSNNNTGAKPNSTVSDFWSDQQNKTPNTNNNVNSTGTNNNSANNQTQSTKSDYVPPNTNASATPAINGSGDAIQQSLQQGLANIKSAYNATHSTGTATITPQQKQLNNLQQQQQIIYNKQQQSAQTTQAVVGLATGLINIWAASQQQKADEQARLQAQQQEQLAEQQRQQEAAREQQQEIQERNINLNNSILGTHLNDKFSDLPRSNSSVLKVYYLAWYRAFNDNTVYIFPAIEVKKYSDGTWPFFKDIKDKMKSKMSDAGASGAEPLLIGYYINESDMQSASNDLINNANLQALVVKKLYLEGSSDNTTNKTEKKTKTTKSFWDN